MRKLCATALKYYKRYRKPVGVCVLAILMAACGPLDAVKGTLYGVKQFVIEARAAGEIVPEKADFLITDLTDATQSVQDLKAALDAIPKDAPDRKQKQLQSVRAAVGKWREIYARGHFGAVSPQVERYGRLANAAFIAIESYYAARAGESSAMSGAAAKSEKELKQEMEQAIKELKAAEKELKK